MKKILSFICLLSSFMIFSGCPYESDVPIDTSSMLLNTRMFGTWAAQNNKDESFKISKHDEFTYSIEKANKKSTDSEVEKYLAFGSTVNGVTFLNISDNNSDASSKKYFLYKMEMKNDGMMTLAEVTENIDERFTTSEELKKFIAANMKNSYFYSKDETTYIKIGK